ncbi:hypothetical protein [Kitasatospora kifunensis]|uniref:Uncharacterized protein n=1 Tax=Kitasatospora kifunensis TaxID=58351 RepID=A0A7W7VV18_KITKI|nr:hypothetical protein [Kitasatospora kifunensis]MBB4923413.1 hypothetical protein [Kitasatospora kifunensis]
MPSTAELVDHRDQSAATALVTAHATATAPRRRRRHAGPPAPTAFGREIGPAAAALQRALDRRDNGGATGH